MRTYWLVEQIDSGLENHHDVNCLTHKKNKHTNTVDDVQDATKSKRNYLHDTMDNNEISSEDLKTGSCQEIQGSNEIQVSIDALNQSRDSNNITPVPAPDLLPKVHFDTRI